MARVASPESAPDASSSYFSQGRAELDPSGLGYPVERRESAEDSDIEIVEILLNLN
jgi:hypothetical protein